jgi:hypothetical protein
VGKIVPFDITFECPVCGESVPAKARSCPECGACDKSGWSKGSAYDGVDLPHDEFDYAKFVNKEFGRGEQHKGIQRLWPIVALILLIAMLLPLLHSCAH